MMSRCLSSSCLYRSTCALSSSIACRSLSSSSSLAWYSCSTFWMASWKAGWSSVQQMRGALALHGEHSRACWKRGGGGSGTQKFVCQNGRSSIIPFVNFSFSHYEIWARGRLTFCYGSMTSLRTMQRTVSRGGRRWMICSKSKTPATNNKWCTGVSGGSGGGLSSRHRIVGKKVQMQTADNSAVHYSESTRGRRCRTKRRGWA